MTNHEMVKNQDIYAMDGGFGTRDAIKKSLLYSSGAGAAMKGQPKKPKKAKKQKEKLPAIKEYALDFGVEGAANA